jgi:glycosyltransferase involved in cell wall biosynthesis
MMDMLSPNDGGVFVDPHDPRSIAEGLLTLFRDPTRLREMGARNRDRAVQYYGKQLIYELFDVYRSALR